MRDKVAQQAVASVLEQMYEEDFLGFSYGFRPGRGQHDALDALHVGLMGKKINWVLDMDIRKFFDTIEHEWLLKFIGHRISETSRVPGKTAAYFATLMNADPPDRISGTTTMFCDDHPAGSTP
jgi:retron-type reverse transcriptase